MITESFDENKMAVINPQRKENLVKCDVVIATFSNLIEEYVVKNFNPTQIGEFRCVNGVSPIYVFDYNGKRFGFYKTLIGSAASVGMMEDVICYFDTKKVLVFGSAGTLDKDCYGKVMIPTFAYRDEGTSYHYKQATDYIEIKNANIVENFMKINNIPYKAGKCWTTDAFYRETKGLIDLRIQQGCTAVEMECATWCVVAKKLGLNFGQFLFFSDKVMNNDWSMV